VSRSKKYCRKHRVFVAGRRVATTCPVTKGDIVQVLPSLRIATPTSCRPSFV
jgi:hypothetical protein